MLHCVAGPLRNTGYAHGFQTRSAWQSRDIAETDPAEHLFTWDFETMEKACARLDFLRLNDETSIRRLHPGAPGWNTLCGFP
jgi:hypothetical protein